MTDWTAGILSDLPAGGTVNDAHSLWYDSPAEEFTQALPLGNGRLGAMCHGGIGTELIQLNDDTAWSGSPGSEAASGPGATNGTDNGPGTGPARIQKARAALEAGDHTGAEDELAQLATAHTQSYLPFAELHLDFEWPGGEQARGYRRSLDLRRAVHEHRYTVAGRTITCQTYASAAHHVLVVELGVRGGALPKVAARLGSQLRVEHAERSAGSLEVQLRLPTDVAPAHAKPATGIQYGQPGRGSLQGVVALRWQHDGRELDGGDDAGGLAATGVSRLRIVVSTATTYAGPGRPPAKDVMGARALAGNRVGTASRLSSAELLDAHTRSHGELYGRAELQLAAAAGTAAGPDTQELPVDRRIRERPLDPGLAALLFNYGRYLLVSSSRPGTLAANLQGIWNEEMQPPWSSNYTININTQMNYWAAEGTGLPECHEPLFDLLEALAESGRRTAREVYGLDGWVAHHNTDAWAFTSPVAGDAAWSFWPMGGAWLATHLWEHVRHGGGTGGGSDFAATRAWPIVRGAAEFCLGWLVPGPDGTLGTSPSTSPENHFQTANGVVAAAGRTSTADIAIIRRLFTAALDLAPAGDALGEKIAAALPRLPGVPVAADGTVQEWAQPFAQPEPHHRHVSHLYFAYPGEAELTPALHRAVARTLDARGDDSTGWSLAWKIALRARLKDAQAVERLLALVFRAAGEQRGHFSGGVYPNLFAAHPPFQIDGNFGYVAGVVECLVQSHAGFVDLLPAVPQSWPEGAVRGLVVRPGVYLDLSWTSDAGGPVLLSARLRARSPEAAGPLTVAWGRLSTVVDVSVARWTDLLPSDFARQPVTVRRR